MTTLRQKLGLLNDTEVLSHSRGVQLVTLLSLIKIISKHVSPIAQRTVAQDAASLELEEFKGFSIEKDSTRIRHCWYALENLNMVERRQGNLYLSNVGAKIAEEIPDLPLLYADLPARSIDILRDAVQSSRYINLVWLSYLGEEYNGTFLLQKVTSNPSCQLIHSLSSYGHQQWSDSGYRIFPDVTSEWQSKCLFSNEQDRSYAPGFIISETARKEIIHGVRKWCWELQITDELPFISPIDIPTECLDLLITVYNVTKILPDAQISLDDISTFIEQRIRQHGNGIRVRIPNVIHDLCLNYRISVNNAKTILEAIHKQFTDKFYFEGASRSVLVTQHLKVSDPLHYYLKIGNIWRSSISILE